MILFLLHIAIIYSIFAPAKRNKKNKCKTNMIMIKQEIIQKLRKDSVLLTKVSAELGKPFPTVKSWVQRESSRLQEYSVLKVLAKILGQEIEDLVENESC